MNIRKACKEDIPEIVELWWDMMQYHKKYQEKIYKPKPRKKFDKIVTSKIKKDLKKQDTILLVAEEKEIIGFILAKTEKEEYKRFKHDLRGYVGELIVKKENRNKGTGKALLQKALQELKKKGVTLTDIYVDKRNKRAIKLYEKTGFKKVLDLMIIDMEEKT